LVQGDKSLLLDLYKLSQHSLPNEGHKKSFRLTSSDVP